jgi:hypothetical protein
MLLKKNSLRVCTERRRRKRLGSVLENLVGQGNRTGVACGDVVALGAGLASSSFI